MEDNLRGVIFTSFVGAIAFVILGIGVQTGIESASYGRRIDRCEEKINDMYFEIKELKEYNKALEEKINVVTA